MADVIRLSTELVPCCFDIVKARNAHKAGPKSLETHILEADVLYAQQYGLRALLTARFDAAEKVTLQPTSVKQRFQSVSSFKKLQSVAVCGVRTESHPSFPPNQGIDCPTYTADIADPEILFDHLKKSHDSGQFILLPVKSIEGLALAKLLTYHVSPLFIGKKV